MHLIPAILFLVLSLLFTYMFCRVFQNTRLMDKPNNRSLHSIPTVRGGGIVFIALPLLAIPYLAYVMQRPMINQLAWIIGCLLIATVSFLDDLYQLSARIRFIIQGVAALLIVFFMRPSFLDFGLFTFTSTLLIIPFLFITVIWAINHFNFMDGLDGFCGSQALFLFCSYALLFHFHHAVFYQGLCLLFSLSLIGFLSFNFPPAKLFMGDVGSATLGYILFSFALIGQNQENIPLLYWFLLNALFLFDSVITLLRRIRNKEPIFSAHKKHAYQRLRLLGVNTGLILLGQMLINGCFLTLVLMSYYQLINVVIVVLIELCLLGFLYYLIERKSPFLNLDKQTE